MKRTFTCSIILISFCFISCSKDVKAPVTNKVAYTTTTTNGSTNTQTQGGTCNHTCSGSGDHTSNSGGGY